MAQLLSILATAAGFVLPGAAQATVIVGGNVGNQTWTVAGSPYIVQGDAVVQAGTTLTIDPGVSVRAAANSDGQASGRDTTKVELIVQGSLNAVGTASSPITFDSTNASSTSDWAGITLSNTAASSSLSYIAVKHATGGLWVNASDAAVNQSTFASNRDWNIRVSGSRAWNLSIQQSLMTGSLGDQTLTTNPGSGVLLDQATGGGTITISNNKMTGNYVGVVSRAGTTAPVAISSNDIRANDGAGLRLVQPTNMSIANNAIVDNPIGVSSFFNSAPVAVSVQNNDLLGGGGYLWDFDGSYDLTAPGNYWGTASESLIGSRVFDGSDDLARGHLTFAPFSSTPVSGLDVTPPPAQITSGPDGPINVTSASFSFSAEAGATFECRLDSGAWSACTSPKNYTALAEGPRTFSVRATDTAGNKDLVGISRNFTVDTIAPTTSIISGPSGTINVASAEFGLSTEPGASLECQLDGGGFAPCTSPKSYSALSNGAHSFSARATDAAGNTDPVGATQNFIVDVTPPPPSDGAPPTTGTTPRTPSTSPSPPGTKLGRARISSARRSATFRFTATGTATGFQCALSKGTAKLTFKACTSSKRYAKLRRGSYRFAVRAIGPGGRDASPATLKFRIR